MLDFSYSLIRLWLVLCVVMALPGEEMQLRSESVWPLFDASIQSWWGPVPDHTSHFVVRGVEIGGRWSVETSGFLGACKSHGAVPLMRKRGLMLLSAFRFFLKKRRQNGHGASIGDRLCQARPRLWPLPLLLERCFPTMLLSVFCT